MVLIGTLVLNARAKEYLSLRNVVTALERDAGLTVLGRVCGFVPAYLLIGRNNDINITPTMLVAAQTRKAT